MKIGQQDAILPHTTCRLSQNPRLKGPNGIAFSPDEKYLYVTNWDEQRKIVMRYEANGDGTLSKGNVFFDMTGAPGEDALDGMKVDQQGNLYVSGPGGLWILSPEGKHLGAIIPPKHPHNMAWGRARQLVSHAAEHSRNPAVTRRSLNAGVMEGPADIAPQLRPAPPHEQQEFLALDSLRVQTPVRLHAPAKIWAAPRPQPVTAREPP